MEEENRRAYCILSPRFNSFLSSYDEILVDRTRRENGEDNRRNGSLLDRVFTSEGRARTENCAQSASSFAVVDNVRRCYVPDSCERKQEKRNYTVAYSFRYRFVVRCYLPRIGTSLQVYIPIIWLVFAGWRKRNKFGRKSYDR